MRSVLLSTAFLTLAGAGCRTEPDKPEAAPLLLTAKTATPKDHLAPAELVVGQEKAFALPLPRDLKVLYRFPSAVHAEGTVSGEAVANFFRARVQGGEVQVAARETRFVGVRVPAEPSRFLQIRVTFDRLTGCHVVIEDVTPPPAPTGSPADRMRQVGLTPDGKLLNPNKLE
ncbi:MAG: hypothetical protein U0174_06900 [Polyangiaceae bacterium]